MKQWHYIYRTTCLVNFKYYIGMHSTYNLEDGYFGSGKILKRSIKKYGKEKHFKEILEYLPDRVSLAERERELVGPLVLSDRKCMNLVEGGEGGRPSVWRKLKRAQRPSSNKKHSSYKKFLMGCKKGGSTSWEKHKRLPPKNGFEGKVHNKKTRDKMSKSKKGNKNPSFGSKWIFNENLKKSKRVKREDLEFYLSTGWKLGRKIKF